MDEEDAGQLKELGYTAAQLKTAEYPATGYTTEQIKEAAGNLFDTFGALLAKCRESEQQHAAAGELL